MYSSFPLCIHQTDAQHLKISAGADRSRHKWELRMQDSHVVESRGSWEQRKDLGGSVFYFCKSEEGLPEPFRWDFYVRTCVIASSRVPVRPRQNSNERGTARGRVVCHVVGMPPTYVLTALDRGGGLLHVTLTLRQGTNWCESVLFSCEFLRAGDHPCANHERRFSW